jgi:hypothetical protein
MSALDLRFNVDLLCSRRIWTRRRTKPPGSARSQALAARPPASAIDEKSNSQEEMSDGFAEANGESRFKRAEVKSEPTARPRETFRGRQTTTTIHLDCRTATPHGLGMACDTVGGRLSLLPGSLRSAGAGRGADQEETGASRADASRQKRSRRKRRDVRRRGWSHATTGEDAPLRRFEKKTKLSTSVEVVDPWAEWSVSGCG